MPARRVLAGLFNAAISIGHCRGFIPLTLVLLTIALALWRLEAAPPLWWDEGWTLCEARSWTELGHYGCLMEGKPGPSILSASFTVVAPIALSFRLFGVGIWQARIVGVLFTAGAMGLLYCLANRLYNRSVAIATLVILLLIPNAGLHPVAVGKQVLAEMPALFFLLGGYAVFFLTMRNSLWFLPLVFGCWGIALITKAQVMPFWATSLFVPLAIALPKRRWRVVGLLGVVFSGSLAAYRLLLSGQRFLLRGNTLGRDPVNGLYDVTALVLDSSVRLDVLRFALIVGLPLLLGLGYATWKWVRNYRKSDLNDAAELVRLMLLALAGSWFAWYALLSIGWDRYLFPVVFIGSPLIASFFHDLTDGFNLTATIKVAAMALAEQRFQQLVKPVIGVSFLLVMTVSATGFFQLYFGSGDMSVLQVTRFFNTATPSGAMIETYDSELFLLLDRPYHYPPAQLHVELNRRTFLRQDVPINYDPLAADPDYLVVGPFSRMWRLYEPILETGAFRLLQTYGRYEVYERVR
jgi:hypothetical protein